MLLHLLSCLTLITPILAPPSAIEQPARNIERQATTITTTVPFHTPCPSPCGYYNQLCCEAGQVCYTDANNQAQCGASAPQDPNGCPLWTTTTTTFETYVETTFDYVVIYTRTEAERQVVIKTVSWQVNPRPTDCCEPPMAPMCDYALGRTPCGNICCASGQYCQAVGVCVSVGGSISGEWQYYTTTYVETDLMTVRRTYSSFVGGESSSLYTTTALNTVTAPTRPSSTSGTIVTVTQT